MFLIPPLCFLRHVTKKFAMASFLFCLHISDYYTVVYLEIFSIQYHWSMTVHAFPKQNNTINKINTAMLSTFSDAPACLREKVPIRNTGLKRCGSTGILPLVAPHIWSLVHHFITLSSHLSMSLTCCIRVDCL